MDGGDDVAAGLEPEPSRIVERSRASRPNEPRASAITSPTTWISPRTPSARSVVARALVGREEERGDAVDLDPVALLGHLEVAAAKAGLDVGDRERRATPARAPASVEFVSP